MASVVDTQTLGKRMDDAEKRASGGGRGKSSYIKLDKKVRVRPIGNIFEVYKFFVKRKDGSARSVCVKPEDVEEASRILTEHAGYEVTPQNRYAVNAIDRATQTVGILENGISIFGVFGQWSNSTGIHPGSKDGYDWEINPKGTGFNRKYTSIPVKATPLTAEEKKMIKGTEDKPGTFDLEEIYKETPLDQLIDKVFGERQDAGPEPVAEEPDNSGDDDDELLGTSTKAKW